MNTRTAAPARSITVAIAGTAVTSLAIVLAWSNEVLRTKTGWSYPSWGELALHIAWMSSVAAITLLAYRLLEHRWPSATDLGIGRRPAGPAQQGARRAHAVVAMRICWTALAAMTMFGFHPGATATESVRWASVSKPLVIAILVARFPVSVIAHQVCYFGWLQPRLGRWSLPIAAFLYAASHLAHPLAVIYVLPLGFIFAIQRRITGRIRAGIVTHYLINVAILVISAS